MKVKSERTNKVAGLRPAVFDDAAQGGMSAV